MNEPLVDLQAFDVTAAQREIVAMYAQDVEMIGMAFKNAGEEFDFEIELSVVARADEHAPPPKEVNSLSDDGLPLLAMSRSPAEVSKAMKCTIPKQPRGRNRHNKCCGRFFFGARLVCFFLMTVLGFQGEDRDFGRTR